MPTAKKTLSTFLTENAENLLTLSIDEGFVFSVKESSQCITVRCRLPNNHVRFVIFDDHRTENPHEGKPHVCNQWHKAMGDPISFTIGSPISDPEKLHKVLLAVSVMCITQSDGYTVIKEAIFE